MRLRTKIALGFAALITSVVGTHYLMGTSLAEAANTYSEGCRVGVLTKYSGSGWVSVTGEGELHLGSREAGRSWHFSSTRRLYEQNKHLVGRQVVACYRQPMMLLHSLDGNTDYRATSFDVVSTNTPAACSVPNHRPGIMDRSHGGSQSGHIVKASLRGNVFKTYEITVWLGGNRFIDMSITDESIYDCAMRFLRANQPAILTYEDDRLRNPFNRDTYLRVLAIAPVAE